MDPHGPLTERMIRRIDAEENLKYIKALCRAVALMRGDEPLASHLFCTQFLEDKNPEERRRGIEIGLAWGARAELTIVGIDRGISPGMIEGINRARLELRSIEWVTLALFAKSWVPPGVQPKEWRDFHEHGELIVQIDD
jgi:hypothetical protein